MCVMKLNEKSFTKEQIYISKSNLVFFTKTQAEYINKILYK